MDDMFVAFTMVQQIMTGLSSAASEEEKVSIITKSENKSQKSENRRREVLLCK
jgi:hypothetical protein